MARSTISKRLGLVFAPLLIGAILLSGHARTITAQPNAHRTAIGTPTLKWSRCPPAYCETGWYASPAAADIDNDGQVEVLWGGYTLMTVNGATGGIEWSAAPPGGGRLWPGIVVADIDNNGSLEIVTGNGAGYISIYTGSGGVYPGGWPIQPTGASNEIRSLAVSDLDANGDLEIVVCSTRPDNQWFVYEHTGALRAGWPKMTDSDTDGYAAGCFNENVGVADIDGDGRGEIVGPNDTHYTAAFNDDGSPARANAIYGQVGGQNKPWARVGVHVDHAVDLRGYAFCGIEHRPNFAASAPSIADVNGDGALEIIIVGNVYNCGANPYTDLYEMPFIFKADRTRWSGSGYDWTAIPSPDASAAPLTEDYSVIENNQPNPVVADLDGDCLQEILYPSYDGRLHAYWLDKTEKHSWPFEVYTGGAYRFASEPAVADLDGDGKAEVIFTTWTQKGSNLRGDLKIVSWPGTQLQSVQLPATGDDWGGALPAPTLANIDGDADIEILIGSTHTGLLAYDVPGTANANVLWGTGRGSHRRAGTVAKGSLCGSGMSANTIAPAPGEVVTFTLALRNVAGPALSGARLTDTLPSLLTYARGLAATSGSAGQAGNTITWTGTVSNSTPVTVTFAVTVSASIVDPTIIINTATIDDGQGAIRTASVGLGVNTVEVYLPIVRK